MQQRRDTHLCMYIMDGSEDDNSATVQMPSFVTIIKSVDYTGILFIKYPD